MLGWRGVSDGRAGALPRILPSPRPPFGQSILFVWPLSRDCPAASVGAGTPLCVSRSGCVCVSLQESVFVCGVSPLCLSEIGSALSFALFFPSRCASPPTCSHTAGPWAPLGMGGTDHNFAWMRRGFGFSEWADLWRCGAGLDREEVSSQK